MVSLYSKILLLASPKNQLIKKALKTNQLMIAAES